MPRLYAPGGWWPNGTFSKTKHSDLDEGLPDWFGNVVAGQVEPAGTDAPTGGPSGIGGLRFSGANNKEIRGEDIDLSDPELGAVTFHIVYTDINYTANLRIGFSNTALTAGGWMTQPAGLNRAQISTGAATAGVTSIEQIGLSTHYPNTEAPVRQHVTVTLICRDSLGREQRGIYVDLETAPYGGRDAPEDQMDLTIVQPFMRFGSSPSADSAYIYAVTLTKEWL